MGITKEIKNITMVFDAVKKIQEFLPQLDSDDRLEIFFKIHEGYCIFCGYPDPKNNCPCDNDE